ncbi:hypothetical protein GCM10027051_22960 [Niabella terrae]
MKYKILMFLLLMIPGLSRACDICGCGAGNGYIGILPEFHRHIMGLRYRYNAILSHLGTQGQTTYLTSREQYRIAEVWGGWNITDKFRVMASLPYSFNDRTRQEVRNSKSGLGDISLSGFYELLGSRETVSGKKDQSRLLVQSLWLGGGVKLATGTYNPVDKSDAGENANLFQLGTGSYDFNLTAMYDIRLQDAGVNINGNYRINTTNKYAYHYGNKFSLNAQAYYKFRTKNEVMIAPNAGLQLEQARSDEDRGLEVTASGGRLLMGTIGLETGWGKWALGANYQTPLTQQLAGGIIQAQDRFMIHLARAL